MGDFRRNGRNIAIGVVVAGVAGYLLGILTAPQSGKETREDINDRLMDAKNDLLDQLDDIEERLSDMIDEAKYRSRSLGGRARSEMNDAILKAKESREKAKEVMRAFRAGEAEAPELDRAIKQSKQAAKNLKKYLKN